MHAARNCRRPEDPPKDEQRGSRHHPGRGLRHTQQRRQLKEGGQHMGMNQDAFHRDLSKPTSISESSNRPIADQELVATATTPANSASAGCCLTAEPHVLGQQQPCRIPVSAHRRIRQSATLPRLDGGTTCSQGNDRHRECQCHPTHTGRTGGFKGECFFQVHVDPVDKVQALTDFRRRSMISTYFLRVASPSYLGCTESRRPSGPKK